MDTQARPALENEEEGNKLADRKYREAAVKHAVDHDADWEQPLSTKPAQAQPAQEDKQRD